MLCDCPCALPAEWNIIYDKLARCAESGAKVVLSRLAIGDLATQYFADRDIFCAGRVRAVLATCLLNNQAMRFTCVHAPLRTGNGSQVRWQRW